MGWGYFRGESSIIVDDERKPMYWLIVNNVFWMESGIRNFKGFIFGNMGTKQENINPTLLDSPSSEAR